MKLTTVLFDLDGTLLPMDMIEFVKAYCDLLARRMAPRYAPKALIDALWEGTFAMTKNDGAVTNEEAFWSIFQNRFGSRVLEDLPLFEEFYRTDFENARASCGFTEHAATTLALCRQLGLGTILATNPVFPAVATQARIRWAGLSPENFSHITTYENSHFCKPKPEYYREILEKARLRPEECLMVGNDVNEDMAARELGMQVFLLTPCLINKDGKDISAYPHGDFPELWQYLRNAVR